MGKSTCVQMDVMPERFGTLWLDQAVLLQQPDRLARAAPRQRQACAAVPVVVKHRHLEHAPAAAAAAFHAAASCPLARPLGLRSTSKQQAVVGQDRVKAARLQTMDAMPSPHTPLN